MKMAAGSKELAPDEGGSPKPPKRIAGKCNCVSPLTAIKQLHCTRYSTLFYYFKSTGVSIMNVIGTFVKKVSTVGIIYFLGYYQLSVAWLIGPVIFSVIRDEWKKEKELKRTIAKAAAMCNEKEVILARVDDLPSWVSIISNCLNQK